MKKFFSAFLLMTAMVLSVGTFVACNDLTEEMETVQTQATSNAAAIKALGDQITALQQALATAQSTADAAKAAGEEAKAAAAQAKADAIKEAKAECETLKAALEAKINENADAIVKLTALVNTKIEAIDAELAKMATIAKVDEAVANLVKADTDIKVQIEAIKKYAADSLVTIKMAEDMRAELLAADATLGKALQDSIAVVMAYAEELEETITNGIEGLQEKVDAVTARVEKLEAAVTKMDANLKTLTTFAHTSLRGLVFIPEFYEEGIEATEYTYMYAAETLTSDQKAVDTKDENNVAVKIAKRTGIEYKVATKSNGSNIVKYVNPVKYVSYWMNPSNADIAGADLAFISKDVAAKASMAAPTVAGDFKIGQMKDDEGKERNYLRVPMKASGEHFNSNKYDADKAYIFALNAGIQANAKDTTIVSDYARVLPSQLNLEGIAYAKTNNAVDCSGTTPKFDHLYATAKAALEAAPTLKVKYNGSIDLRKEIVTHYTIKNNSAIKVYEADFMAEGTPADEQNPYGLVWKFDTIDYTAGTNATSETQHCTLAGSVLTPCGVTNGVANGTPNVTSVGRRPLVRVTVSVDDAVILVGFIKLEITREVPSIVADETAFTVQFGYEKYQANTEVPATPAQTWAQFVDNVLEVTDLSKEEFYSMYKLQVANGAAVQYYNNETFKAFEGKTYNNAGAIATHDAYGVITEVADAAQGTTTNVLKWTIDAATQQRIFEANADHTVTVYVRYVKATDNAPSTNLDGVFVPLKVTVTKPQGKVTKKISEYWFNGEKNAMLNVLKPTDGQNTTTWESDINDVWQGNKPNFNAPTSPDKTIAVAQGETWNYIDEYKYYFAPEQPTYGNYELVAGPQSLPSQRYSATHLATLKANLAVAYIHEDYNYFEVNKSNGYKVAVTNESLPTVEYKYALDYTKGVYTNDALYAVKKVVNNPATYELEMIATIDQTNSVVTYLNTSNVAKELLNMYASVPRSEAKLSVNIAVAANLGWNADKVAFSLTENETNAYNFLRPINITDSKEGKFVDGTANNNSNVNLIDLFDLTDWRDVKIDEITSKTTAAGTEYYAKNAWLFAFYNINKAVIDLNNVMCDLNQADGTFVKMSTITTKIDLSVVSEKNTVSMNGRVATVEFTYDSSFNKEAASTYAAYEEFAKCFGKIVYKNNGNAISGFNIKVPVTFHYDWGAITVDAVIPVEKTMGN